MIKVIISRSIIDGLEANYEQAARRILHHAGNAPGYISGETYRDLEKAGQYIVISNWESVNAWRLWLQSDERVKMLRELGMYLAGPEQFTVLEPSHHANRVRASATLTD